MKNLSKESINYPGAVVEVIHSRPLFDNDGNFIEFKELFRERVHNVLTTVGIDFIHSQAYASSGIASNGFNYIALSNDTLTETSASTTLSNEIAANGLSRAQGTVAHTAGTTLTTITKTFTVVTASQSVKKIALFNASTSGIMNHVLAITPRTLDVGDTLTIVAEITIG